MLWLIGLILTILHIIALVEIVTSKREVGYKLMWALIVILAPLVGMIVYYIVGRDMRDP